MNRFNPLNKSSPNSLFNYCILDTIPPILFPLTSEHYADIGALDRITTLQKFKHVTLFSDLSLPSNTHSDL